MLFLSVGAASLQAQESGTAAPSWQPPPLESVRAQALAWLDEQKADATVRSRAEALWKAETLPPDEALDRLVRTFALVDANVRDLVDYCSRPRGNSAPPPRPWLVDPNAPPLVSANVRLWYARWLLTEEMYDEALELVDALRPDEVVDPAALLFCQAAANYRLLNKEAGNVALGQLLEGAEAGPQRYIALARLMEADLRDVKEDSLNHIARRMDDVGRRLDLGRGGKKVRKIEDGIVESLDKLIKQIEDQQQAASSGSGNSTRSTKPAQDSRPMGGKGEGNVQKKNVGNSSGWGDLPPKERDEALQHIGREFPSHYREAIEQYFRKQAGKEND